MSSIFSRKLLKTNAKTILRRHYGKALLLSLIIGVTGTLLSMPELLSQLSQLSDSVNQLGELTGTHFSFGDIDFRPSGYLWNTFLPLITAASYVYSLATSYLLPASYSRYYLQARENPAKISDIFYPFKSNFGAILGTHLCRDLLISAWFLALYVGGFILSMIGFFALIPSMGDSDAAIGIGIAAVLAVVLVPSITMLYAKNYQYSMVPYILAENPNLPVKRILKMSTAMTNGYKWKLFVLDLSFLGWQLLALLIPFIGAFLLQPYLHAVRTEAYVFLKARAISRGDAAEAEFIHIKAFVPAAPAAPITDGQQADALTAPESSAEAIEGEAPAAGLTDAETAEPTDAIPAEIDTAEEICETENTADAFECEPAEQTISEGAQEE